MKKYIIASFIILGFLLPTTTKAQQEDITGVWNGYLELMDSANNPVKLPYEIAVSEEKGKLVGYSRIIFHANGKDEAGMQGIVLKWKGKEIIIEDEGFVEHEFSINPSRRVKKTMVMTLTLTETEMTMEGSWSTNRTKTYIQMKGTSMLKRKNDFKSAAIYKRLDTLKIAEKLSFKDRPETAPTVAVVMPVEKKPVPVPEPEPEPELIIPPVANTGNIELVAVEKKQQPAAKILPLTKQKKMQMDALAKMVIKPAPKPIAPPVKPEPVVVVAEPKPKPEKKAPPAPKPEPVVVKTTEPAVTPKPAPPVVQPAPKPVPPPIAVVAPSVTQGAAELDKRVTKADKEYYFESDSLVLTLYDNGEVDGDTVTVIMNGGIIFSKTRLTEKPNTKTIYISNNMDSVKLVMYAESLGEIPPNTGLLVVMDGEKRYDVRFSADLKTNAAIILRRRKDQ